ncbi:hypothetical protein LSTR_LSTR016614 [Laodelphax striatellus]|nr:hypothetical protein LSTR_LSTR016614 [Laodelphax striatellus]
MSWNILYPATSPATTHLLFPKFQPTTDDDEHAQGARKDDSLFRGRVHIVLNWSTGTDGDRWRLNEGSFRPVPSRPVRRTLLNKYATSALLSAPPRE